MKALIYLQSASNYRSLHLNEELQLYCGDLTMQAEE